ncbi:DUF2442 domain-containing protein [Clostridium phoceensis]|uniref:DUF2442 domain-containing protein n=1 Tax=Clostridium phoceensis TaxID=1650661 RepID=UPI0023F0F93B|nr:DUF2442 domain-containing protein [Clostridium phoceensis]
MFHKIKTVSPLPDFRLLVSFAEGPSKTYEVSPLFQRVPALAALRDTPGLFQQVRVDPGGYGISWNDELDLDASELWAHGQPASPPAQTPF